MSNYLPQASGYLPYWTLFVSVVAVFNTIQNLLTVSITKQIYSAKPEQVTELSARLFAVWTFTSGVIRFYAAYNLNNKTIYHITIWTYVIAFFYFSSELLYFKSAKIGPGVLSPIVVSCMFLWQTMLALDVCPTIFNAIGLGTYGVFARKTTVRDYLDFDNKI